ncbi:1-hydroxycarotenoid 3,4-desaturase CrtD [Limnovirga soli]|nr:1-hydroxycarotenoid 3,4-desaturase CrtD [Limnovirga soli]
MQIVPNLPADTYSMHQKKAAVIGSGVAGLASAIRLAVQGFSVTVYEKNEYPGGKLSHFEKDGFHFDAGPSLFTQPQNIAELFTLAGENMQDYFSYKQLPISCNYFYEDGTIINAWANANQLAKELHDKTGEDENAVMQYLNGAATLYQNVAEIFLNYSLHKLNTLFKAPILKALQTAKGRHLFGSLHTLNNKAFTKPHTVQLFNRYATYNGSNPYKAPGMLSLIPHLEHNEGNFYPKGGMISITNALYALALKKGVNFKFNLPVERIIESGGKVLGLVADKKNIPADVVISNMDIYGTYKYLLQNPDKATAILKQERSSSALVFYWGINGTFPQLDLHNIFFSNDYKTEFEHLFVHKTMQPDPTVYINITSKCEPGVQAPDGKENWFVMVNAPANIGQNWEEIKPAIKQLVLQKLSRLLQTNIEPLIETEEILDPISIETKTASYMGSLYGSSSNSKMAAFLRHPNFSKNIMGLYFAGGSVHPGGGIPLCLKSAKIMSELVAADFSKQKQH